jgi:hypothetical protein
VNLLSTDCNTNSIPDECDLPPICTSGCSDDCNADLIPDECQLTGNDCNSNGIPDQCDSPDCNTNGIPDECELLASVANSLTNPGFEDGGGSLDPWVGSAPAFRLNGDVFLPGGGHGGSANYASLQAAVTDPLLWMSQTVAVADDHLVTVDGYWAGGSLNEQATFSMTLYDGGGAMLASTSRAVGPSSGGLGWEAVPGLTVGPGLTQVKVEFSFSASGYTLGAIHVDDVSLLSYRPDCNSNGVPDECDIAGATSLDCNSNTVPDECETIAGSDFDNDGDVGLDDYRALADCMAGPDQPPAPVVLECAAACLAGFDRDDDNDVDLADAAGFTEDFGP